MSIINISYTNTLGKMIANNSGESYNFAKKLLDIIQNIYSVKESSGCMEFPVNSKNGGMLPLTMAAN